LNNLGNHKISVKFILPAQKILPLNDYLLDITIVDPCNSSIWLDTTFSTV